MDVNESWSDGGGGGGGGGGGWAGGGGANSSRVVRSLPLEKNN